MGTTDRSVKGWQHVTLDSFVQDTWDWTDPKTGEYYPPTLKWAAPLKAVRSDGVNFFVMVEFYPADLDAAENKIVFMQQILQLAFRQLESYRECACTVSTPCPFHGGLSSDSHHNL